MYLHIPYSNSTLGNPPKRVHVQIPRLGSEPIFRAQTKTLANHNSLSVLEILLRGFSNLSCLYFSSFGAPPRRGYIFYALAKILAGYHSPLMLGILLRGFSNLSCPFLSSVLGILPIGFSILSCLYLSSLGAPPRRGYIFLLQPKYWRAIVHHRCSESFREASQT